MGQFAGKHCDIFTHVTKDVKSIHVSVVEIGDNGKPIDGPPLYQWNADQCPKALTRLEKFIDRGMSPGGKNADEDAGGEANEN